MFTVINLVVIDSNEKSTTKIKWYIAYGGWKMKAYIAGSIILVVLFFFSLIRYFARAPVYRATGIFVLNGFGTDSESDTASEEEVKNNVIDSKTDTASEGEIHVISFALKI